MNQLLQLVIARLREFRREPSAFTFVLLVPVLWLAILGFMFDSSQDERPFKAAVASSAELIASELESSLSPLVSLVHTLDASAAEKKFLKREVDGWIELTADQRIKTVYSDPDSSRSRSMLWAIERLGGKAESAPALSKQQVVRPKSTYIDYLVPGLIAMTVLTTSLFGIGMTLVANRREGLLTKYRSTPVSSVWLFSSYFIGRIFIFSLELATLLFAAFLLFDYLSYPFLWKFFFIGSLGCICFSSLSIFLAAKTSNVGAYSGKANLVMLVFLLIGDVFYRLPALPGQVDQLAKFLPLNTLTQWLRHHASPRLYDAPTAAQIAVFVCLTFVFFLSAMKLFRWSADES